MRVSLMMLLLVGAVQANECEKERREHYFTLAQVTYWGPRVVSGEIRKDEFTVFKNEFFAAWEVLDQCEHKLPTGSNKEPIAGNSK